VRDWREGGRGWKEWGTGWGEGVEEDLSRNADRRALVEEWLPCLGFRVYGLGFKDREG
jgi:hypothetical protein